MVATRPLAGPDAWACWPSLRERRAHRDVGASRSIASAFGILGRPPSPSRAMTKRTHCRPLDFQTAVGPHGSRRRGAPPHHEGPNSCLISRNLVLRSGRRPRLEGWVTTRLPTQVFKQPRLSPVAPSLLANGSRECSPDAKLRNPPWLFFTSPRLRGE